MLPETTRRDMDHVEFSIPDEDFLLRLFGQSMLNIHGVKNQKTWKKIQNKIQFVLDKAIKNNLQSDGFHAAAIQHFLDTMKTVCNSNGNADIQMILSLTGIVLELLGRVPDYTNRRALNRNDDYYLTSFRSLIYNQTPYQKMRTIIEAARRRPYSKYHKSEDLYQTYVINYNGDAMGFLEWYKAEYPKVYCQLF